MIPIVKTHASWHLMRKYHLCRCCLVLQGDLLLGSQISK